MTKQNALQILVQSNPKRYSKYTVEDISHFGTNNKGYNIYVDKDKYGAAIHMYPHEIEVIHVRRTRTGHVLDSVSRIKV